MNQHPATQAFIRRLAKLWNVQPYRIDVDIAPSGLGVEVLLDDKRPPPELIQVLEKDIATLTSKSRGRYVN